MPPTLSPNSGALVLLEELCFIKHINQAVQYIVFIKDAWYFEQARWLF